MLRSCAKAQLKSTKWNTSRMAKKTHTLCRISFIHVFLFKSYFADEFDNTIYGAVASAIIDEKNLLRSVSSKRLSSAFILHDLLQNGPIISGEASFHRLRLTAIHVRLPRSLVYIALSVCVYRSCAVQRHGKILSVLLVWLNNCFKSIVRNDSHVNRAETGRFPR